MYYVPSLPPNYIYRIKESCGSVDDFSATVYANLHDLKEADDWIADYSRLSMTNWNVRQTKVGGVLQRKDYVCHLSSYKHSNNGGKSVSRYKDHSCPAKIIIKIKKVTANSKRRYEWVHDGMPATIHMTCHHSHAILNAEALSLRRIDPRTREQFMTYFDEGMSASTASDFHLDQLGMDPTIESSAMARSDHSVNPSRASVNSIYKQWRNINMGERKGKGMWEVLTSKLEVYKEQGSLVATHENPLTIVVVTPIMHRAHSLVTSSDILFVDSTSSCDSENHVLTFLLVKSPHGAVPAGVIISSGQSTEEYVRGFTMLKTLLCSSAFNGQGYPSIIMTDDSAAERTALHLVWPESLLLLCHFHILQSVWRWLWNANHGIRKDDRKPLMMAFRRVLYSVTEDEAAQQYSELIKLASSQPLYCVYVEDLWDRREVWCMAWRCNPLIRGHHTNNYSEVTVRLFKDNILSRCRAYNAVALVDFIITMMDKFYRNRLEQYANGRITMYSLLLQKLLVKCSYIVSRDSIICQEEDDGLKSYCVPSETKTGLYYHVDPQLGTCGCHIGLDGRCCKHQIAVFKWFTESLPNFPPVTSDARYEAARLALGDNTLPREFYNSILVNPSELSASRTEASICLTESSVTLPELSTSHSEPSTSNDHVIEPPVVQPVDGIPEAKDSLEDLFKCVRDAADKFLPQCNTADVVKSIKKLKEKFVALNNASQFCSLMSTHGNRFYQSAGRPYRYAGSYIRVQPTSVARRTTPGITRGAKRQSSGRPFAGERKGAKRPRNLLVNIEANLPNAKSHGVGH